jgi:hypothetical protein
MRLPSLSSLGPSARLIALLSSLGAFSVACTDPKRADDDDGNGNGLGDGDNMGDGTGTGGAPPSNASVGCRRLSASGDDATIDSFEDGDLELAELEGQNGFWFPTREGVELEVEEPDSPFQGQALHITAEPENVAGRGVGLVFLRADGVACPYNLSAFDGVTFWARGSGPLRFSVAVPGTMPIEEGGSCFGEGCGNYHGASADVSERWGFYRFAFRGLAQQPGWGQPAGFDAGEILGMRVTLAAGLGADLWLDDVRFHPDPASPDAGVDAGVLDASVTPPDAGVVPAGDAAGPNDAGPEDAGGASDGAASDGAVSDAADAG